MTGRFDAAVAVADAVLFEGYLLYPYRASSEKNRMRFQFGVLVPPGAREGTGEEPSNRTEVLCEPAPDATLSLRLRFLHLRTRTVEQVSGDGYRPVDSLYAGGREYLPWDEAVERDVTATVAVDTLTGGEVEIPFRIEASEECTPIVDDGRTAGRLVRRCETLTGRVLLSARTLDGPYGGVHLRVDVENCSTVGRTSFLGRPDCRTPSPRDAALRYALIGAHTMLALSGGRFLSQTEPPEWAAAATAACVNTRTWPVLVGAAPGDDTVVLSSPIILSDHPSIAPESPGALYDGTEIDEILTLRTMTLTDDEKRQARATDDRAGAMLDRIDSMPPELLDRLHGTIRYLRQVTGEGPTSDVFDSRAFQARPKARLSNTSISDPDAPWWDPAADTSVDPDTDRVLIDGVPVGKGSRVRLAPRAGGTDAQDMFLAGLLATVQAVLSDVDGSTHVAVTIDGDPGAELQLAQGRFRYFDPAELTPLDPAEPAHPAEPAPAAAKSAAPIREEAVS